MVARRAHNPKVTGSSPVPATKKEKSSAMSTFFVLRPSLTPVNSGIKCKNGLVHLIIQLLVLCQFGHNSSK